MKPDLDSLLATYRESRVPALPGSFAQDVLRDIRLRRTAPPRSGWWQEVLAGLHRPSFITASLSLALVVGAIAPFALGTSDSALSVRGLDLGVFSSSAQDFPSGLLAHLP
ncbi:MAG: hypothetical protein WA771_00420 [Chthoniobacterales bacterium]